MNEQIRNILAQDGTKTSKIRKLLLLGLTHREIADLVTRGNRGFVWNVYKRMRDEGLIVSAGTPTATTTPELDYSFRRKFGVEIEAYNCTCQRLVRELTEAGIEVASERYNHDLRPHWKVGYKFGESLGNALLPAKGFTFLKECLLKGGDLFCQSIYLDQKPVVVIP